MPGGEFCPLDLAFDDFNLAAELGLLGACVLRPEVILGAGGRHAGDDERDECAEWDESVVSEADERDRSDDSVGGRRWWCCWPML